jgi:hypothetical protein
MAKHQYDSLEACRGRLNVRHVSRQSQAERAGYTQVLKTWSSGA